MTTPDCGGAGGGGGMCIVVAFFPLATDSSRLIFRFTLLLNYNILQAATSERSLEEGVLTSRSSRSGSARLERFRW